MATSCATATQVEEAEGDMTLLDAEDSNPSSSDSGFRPLEGLLGSSEGQCLRRMAYDIDLNALFTFLASRDAKALRKQVAIWLASKLDFSQSSTTEEPSEGSPEYEKLQKHRAQRDRRALRFIMRSQWNRLHFRALPSLVLAVAVFSLRVSGATLLLILRRLRRKIWRGTLAIVKSPVRVFNWAVGRRRSDREQPVPQVLTS